MLYIYLFMREGSSNKYQVEERIAPQFLSNRYKKVTSKCHEFSVKILKNRVILGKYDLLKQIQEET